MQTNFRQIKKLIDRLEKKEKELATYKAKVVKLENEINDLQRRLTMLLSAEKLNVDDVVKTNF